MPLWRRAVYTACRAGFERLVLIHRGDPERLRRALAGDPRLEGRRWTVVSPGMWTVPVSEEGGRWVVLAEDWIVDADSLVELAGTRGGPASLADEGPFAADAADLLRWAAAGWTPSSLPLEAPRRTGHRPSVYVRVASSSDVRAAEDALFRSLARSDDNVFARYVDRALSRAISRRLAPYPVTPNQITVFSTFLGIAGALTLLHPSYAAGAIGSILFFLHTVVDGCDGEIARLKFQESPWGARLDLVGDNVVHGFLFPCMALHAHFTDPEGPFLLLGAMALAGVGATWAAVYWLFVRSRPSRLVVRCFELFANREFAYLVLVLGLAGRLEWFVWAMAFGLWLFPAALLAAWALGRRRGTAGT